MAEVAIGFVLGVLPLIISTAEHFDDIVQPFKRYRHYHESVKKFHGSLQTQKTIFRNFCELLLKTLVNHDLAVGIMDRTIDPNKELDGQLIEILGGSADACLRIIEEIEMILQKVEEDKCLELDIQDEKVHQEQGGALELKDLGTEKSGIESEKTSKSIRSKLIKKALKAKFSVSRRRLDEYLIQLKSLNSDFGTLQAQVQQLAKSQPAMISSRRPMSRNIRHLRIFQKSSKQLYEVLAKSCTLHLEHVAHFAVDAEHTEPTDKSQLQITFSLALTHRTSQDPRSAEIPLWMVIESTSLDSWGQPTTGTTFLAPESLMVTLKRECNQEPASQSTKRQRKTVRFDTPTSIPAKDAPLRPPLLLPLATGDVHICKAGNLCTIIRANLGKFAKGKSISTDSSRTCIGILDQNEEYRQVVYPLVRQSTLSDLVTLNEILSRRLYDQSGTFSQYERIRLAGKLATATLKYHETPWLRSGWRSSDVSLFDPAKNNSSGLCTPHFKAKIIPPGRHSGLEADSSCQPFAYNQVLFGLGVVLLELGHEATLQSMQKSTHLPQIDPKHAAASMEFFESQRLGNLVGSRMGSRYARIVQQCLRCDFGCGADLDDIALQERVYKDVVCELEELELKFKALDMS